MFRGSQQDKFNIEFEIVDNVSLRLSKTLNKKTLSKIRISERV
ncbi:hypothetical protein SAMN05421825_1154 [Epilithonimonas hungarica]|jgi:hypothetical protein|uniref:Uncharacterized protein n=1 Tax=Epilithonimonas hungarica TaxID=454006 RepID=A0A1G7IQ19_9FLAO|nr:hypothetical protein [Epilithonimonas hungarica]SDF14715.1 hypothetical protein SAMN05421825_1154 [Epilithonimonas hungarica]